MTAGVAALKKYSGGILEDVLSNRWYMDTSIGRLRIGAQKPRIDIYNDGLIIEAKEAIRLTKDFGNELFKWQKDTIMRWLAVDEDGVLVNRTCGLEIPRQNGKTELIRVRIIYGLVSRGEHIIFTAQSDSTADTVKARVLDFFYENDDPHIKDLLAPKFRKKRLDSYDYLELVTGGRVKFTTRTRMTGLGNTNDVLINDEAQEMTDAQAAALVPTVSASQLGNPQIIYVGTPPEPSGVGMQFTKVRAKALKRNQNVCWREWGVENLHDVNDVEAWYATNPSLNLTILETTVRDVDLVNLTDEDSFNRQRLGWWSGVESKRAITDEQWERLATDKVNLAEVPELVYAVKIAPDRGELALAVAIEMGVDTYHVEVIRSEPWSNGHKWLIDFLSERWRRANGIIIDGWYGKQIIEEDLKTAGVPTKRLVSMSMSNIADAHVFFYEGIERRQVTHFNQPYLNTAVANTKRRVLGKYGGFGWESMSPTEVSSAPIDSVTLAYWGARTLPHLPHVRKKQKMRL